MRINLDDLTGDVTARNLLAALTEHISSGKTGWRSGVRSEGRFASIDIQLPNGQEFRLQIEEL